MAPIIGASEWWVREQARKRVVPHLRFGRDQMRFRRSDVIALMELVAVALIGEPTMSDPADQGDDAGGGVAKSRSMD